MRVFASLLALGLAVGCVVTSPELDEATSRADAIINGEPTTGYLEVVAVVTVTSGGRVSGLCSGTVIAPQVVLTAKHCIDSGGTRTPVSRLRVYVGSDVQRDVRAQHEVTQVFTTPGPFVEEDLVSGNDIALLRTATAIATPTREVARSTARRGMPITIVGFGRTRVGTGGASSGVKHIGTTNVGDIYLRVFQTVGRSRTCSGDSGGPAFDAAGRVLGITSFGFEACREDQSFYTEVAPHLALIEQALGGDAPCTAQERLCNGADDDCDGVVDAGCGTLGADCRVAADCMSRDCRPLEAGRAICTQSCDPFVEGGTTSCPDGTYCDLISCGAGACVPGGPGMAPDGAACTRDVDCASAHCQPRGDAGICGRPCQNAGAPCPSGFRCETEGTPCGVCVTEDRPMLPFATPCFDDADCGSGICNGFCSRECASDADCGEYRCEGDLCVDVLQRPRGGHGASCDDLEDCVEGLACVQVDGEDVCASPCAGDVCPEGTRCDLGLCVLEGAPLGERCDDGSECRSGLCAGVCTRVCSGDEGCPRDFECAPAGEVSACFRRTAPPEEEPSGRCSAAGGADGAPIALLALGLWARRRTRGRGA